jgi:predicted TIM-barrel enzyme
MPDPALDLFPRAKPVVAVLDVGPMPGGAGAVSVWSAEERAVAEARVLLDLGVDGVLVEGEPSGPDDLDACPETVAFMTRIAVAVRRNVNRLPVGVCVPGAGRAALAVAHAAGCHFVRVCERGGGGGAEPVPDYRARIGAGRLPLFADLCPHDADDAAALAGGLAWADAAVVLGPEPGRSPTLDVAAAVRAATDLPLFCGGLGPESLPDLLDRADGFVVGSGIKEQCRRRAPVCEPRVRSVVGALEYARGQEVRQ